MPLAIGTRSEACGRFFCDTFMGHSRTYSVIGGGRADGREEETWMSRARRRVSNRDNWCCRNTIHRHIGDTH
jgi:hypothetical protein